MNNRVTYQPHTVLQWTEAQFQAHVLQLAALYGWRAYHTHDSRRSQPGFPDLVLVNPRQGRTLFRELKRQKGRISQHQRDWLADLNQTGQDAGIWRPEDLVSGLIQTELQPTHHTTPGT